MKYLLMFLIFLNCSELISTHSNSIKKRVDIVFYSNILMPNSENPVKYSYINQIYDVHFFYDLYKYVDNFTGDSKDLKKIIFFDHIEDSRASKLPKDKMICFRWEAIKIAPKFYDYYYRVYTFDDDLVDEKKFFKFYYPVLQPRLLDIPSFHDKKFCTMIAGNWIRERVKILDFFANKSEDCFFAYGKLPEKYLNSKINKGPIPGGVSSQEKLNTLKNYKFCICFENTHSTKGYITEKIFDVFASGCVPVYWGPKNVKEYIPSNCYIDYKNFKNDDDMYHFLLSVTEEQYNNYLNNILLYLESDQAKLFSPENFDKLIYDAVSN